MFRAKLTTFTIFPTNIITMWEGLHVFYHVNHVILGFIRKKPSVTEQIIVRTALITMEVS